ncbi:RHS repeat domain-containing protein [Spirochaeta cellobiosiphila]|uniref:RHS repeat domain-containing protein n=1 Tax=Spirochaeta cellobiosiphila TaxID=504483 RepID=UPI0003F95D0B|nr:RHS repeat-associated core domain-containing protein [Spirochaeta cellobiosiphila]
MSRPCYFYYSIDHLGSSVAITDEAGEKLWSAEYTPFGDKVVIDNPSGRDDFDFKYTGKDYDDDLGFYYFNARWYDAQAGRFITEDPARDGSNWYLYTANNPLRYIDPTGLTRKKADDGGTGTTEEKSTWEKVKDVVSSVVKAIQNNNPSGGSTGGPNGRDNGDTSGGSSSEQQIDEEEGGDEVGLPSDNQNPGQNEVPDDVKDNLDWLSDDNLADGSLTPNLDELTIIDAVKSLYDLGSKASKALLKKTVGSKIDEAVSTSIKSLDDLLDMGVDWKKLKNGTKQANVTGDANKIISDLAESYGQTLQESGHEIFFKTDDLRMGLHTSAKTGEATIHINNGGKLFKIRVNN